MSEETITTEEMNTETEQPVGIQATAVVKYLEEVSGAITMLASNINNQIKQLTELIENQTNEKETTND